ncbi:SPFH domain-containing protein [Oligoflexia bacterium]|nr:SPFH domain-containing protein [Oligoflexia bacterium]
MLLTDTVKNSESGAIIKGLLSLIILIAIVVCGIAYTFGYVVPPGMIGIRRIGVGPGQGYSEKALDPGYHWGVPFLSYSTVHLVPQTVQILNFHRDRKNYPDSPGSLDVQTTDGAKVLVDLTLFARFYKNAGTTDSIQHGGPADLIKEVGLLEGDWYNRIYRNADDELRRGLGKLSTAEFYNPLLREKQVRIGMQGMNRDLARFGIKVDAVLLRRYTYVAEPINDAIFRKNLQDQEERLNATLTQFAEVTAELEQKRADYDARIKTLMVEGQSDAKVVRSEGNLYEEKKMAEANLLVAKAVAEVDRLKAGALAQSAASEIYVARELAPMLGSLKGGIVTALDPYNLDKWSERLGVSE